MDWTKNWWCCANAELYVTHHLQKEALVLRVASNRQELDRIPPYCPFQQDQKDGNLNADRLALLGVCTPAMHNSTTMLTLVTLDSCQGLLSSELVSTVGLILRDAVSRVINTSDHHLHLELWEWGAFGLCLRLFSVGDETNNDQNRIHTEGV